MKKSMIQARKVEKGIAATEYLIILLVVAVSAIALFMRYGQTVRDKITAAGTDVTTNVNNQDTNTQGGFN